MKINYIDRLIVALDVDTKEKALSLVDRLKNDVKFFKVGFELFSSCGPDIVREIREKDCEVFLDLKFHDIPTTVLKSAVAVTRLGVFMFNVHASGGYDMMKNTAESVKREADALKIRKPKVIAVTVLTSMDENGLKKIGVNDAMKSQVVRLASLAKDSGLDGVVASTIEAEAIREKLGGEFLIVTPGIRPAWAAANDQKRVATPKDAMAAGANYIVVGRPITESHDPAHVAREILKEMEG